MISPDALLIDENSICALYTWLKTTDADGFMLCPCGLCGRHFVPELMDAAHVRGTKRFCLSIASRGNSNSTSRVSRAKRAGFVVGIHSDGVGYKMRPQDVPWAEYVTEVWKCFFLCKGCHYLRDVRLKRGKPVVTGVVEGERWGEAEG